MFFERNLVKICDLNPLSFPKLIGKRKLTTWNKFLVGTLAIICFFTVVFCMFVIPYKVTDIGTFVAKLRYTYFIVSILFNTYAFFSIDKMDTVGLEDLINVDLELENMISAETDLSYLVLICLALIHTVLTLRFTHKLHTLYLLFDRYLITFTAYQSALMKNMVAKRIKWIQVKAKTTENGLELLAPTRSILGFNEKVNKIFTLRIANVVVGGLLTFLNCMSAYWQLYGLHKEIDCYESSSPIIALVVQGHIIAELFCLGEKMSKISNCVETLSWEINKRMCCKEYSFEHRKKLEVFMLELAHTPTDLTAADLFSVNNSFITSVASFIITVMMIFIQFMT